MAIDELAEDDELLILNGDQIIDISFELMLQFWKEKSADAGLVTFKSVHPRWSYARITDGLVVQTAEKNPISNNAIAGVYYFNNSKCFMEASFSVIKNDVQLNGNYFISPVINEFVLKSKSVFPFNIDTDQYHIFYSPQVLQDFERKFQNNGNV
jgi:NDP-sugar pyrophosphorylase family protein